MCKRQQPEELCGAFRAVGGMNRIVYSMSRSNRQPSQVVRPCWRNSAGFIGRAWISCIIHASHKYFISLVAKYEITYIEHVLISPQFSSAPHSQV